MLLLPVGLMGSAPAVAIGGLLLDSIAVVGAYSVRKLRSAYAGPCLRVLRDSDNTELDVGFAAGALDAAALLAFCGTANGYVTRWHDQGGGGNHAIQPETAYQPRVVNAGALNTQGGRACLGDEGGNSQMRLPGGMFAGLSSSTAVCLFSQVPSYVSGWWIIGSSGLFTHSPYSDGAAYEQYLATTRPGFAGYGWPTNAPTVHTAHNDGAALSVFKNGTQVGAAQAVTFTNAPSITAGDYRNSQVNLSEMVLTAGALSTSSRQAVERSMGAYFGVSVA